MCERVDGLVDCADSDCCQSDVCQSLYEHVYESDRDRLLRQYGACAGVKEARQELLIHEDRGPLVSLLERTLFMRAREERDPRDKSVQLNFHAHEFHAGYLIFLTLLSTADNPFVCSHACSRASIALSRVCCMLISRQASVAGERSSGARGRQPHVRLHRRGRREPLEARSDAERPKRNVRYAQLLLVLIEFLEARASLQYAGSTTC